VVEYSWYGVCGSCGMCAPGPLVWWQSLDSIYACQCADVGGHTCMQCPLTCGVFGWARMVYNSFNSCIECVSKDMGVLTQFLRL